ncbi:MAG: DUF1080 domain-containing protein [Saprospiraceae bacterium]|nr:DUF1080 domain-containing protein [Saprospiraceae bacterium]
MKYLCAFLLCCLSSFSITAQEATRQAFDGHTLKGWVVPAQNIWWTAKEGILTAKSDSEQTGSILWTKKKYRNFVMEFEFRFGQGTVDSGVFIREEKLQVQLGESGSLKRDMTASPYVPGKGYPVEARNIDSLLKPREWNHMRIIAKGPSTIVFLNGQQVMEYQSENSAQKGPIGLQLHPKRDMDIAFRDVRISKMK